MKRDNKLRSKIRNEFGINETDVVIGNVARMVEMKGQEYLIKAFSLLLADSPVILSEAKNPINQTHDLRGAERRSGHPLAHPIDETNGFVVPDKNPEAIAEKLRVLLEDKNLREKMGRASLEHLKKNFTVEKMIDSIEAVYNKVIHTNKK